MSRPRLKQHPAAIIVLGTGVLLAADAGAWLLWLVWKLARARTTGEEEAWRDRYERDSVTSWPIEYERAA